MQFRWSELHKEREEPGVVVTPGSSFMPGCLKTHSNAAREIRSPSDRISPIIETHEYNIPQAVFLSEKGVKGEKLFIFF